MDYIAEFLFALGGILLLSVLAHTLGKRTFLPRVTLLLLFGILIGQNGLNIIPNVLSENFELISDMALLMVGFLLGGKLTARSFKSHATSLMWISLCSAIFTSVLVTLALMLLGAPLELAIVLGCIASATDAAAVFDVVNESKQDNSFTRLLLGIVALDDVWALIIFGVGIAVVGALNGYPLDTTLSHIGWELGGAIILGAGLGLPAAFLTGRVRPGQPIIAEALGLVFVCGGIALHLEVSFLIAAMVMGCVIANLAKHHHYPFHAIEDIEWPFMLVFFVLAGASLELEIATSLGVVGLVYLVFRGLGKWLGALIGSEVSQADRSIKRWIGVGMLPQAGVAIGLALLAAKQLPEHQQILLSVVISSTVIFELIGPLMTRFAIKKASR